MKRTLAILLAACLLLSGCGVITETDETGAIVSTSVLDMSSNESTGRVMTSAVYFYNPTSGMLTAEPRRLLIRTDTNPAEAAVQALLAGPSESSGLTSVAPVGMTLDSIEFSREVANVYLLYDGAPMQQLDEYTLELAIANTVTDILGATYICVFLNGMQTGFKGGLRAPLKKQTVSVKEALDLADAKFAAGRTLLTDVTTPDEAQSTATPAVTETDTLPTEEPYVPETMELQTVLYYISKDGGYLLPEVHTIKYTQGKVVDALIAELKKTPNNSTLMKSPLSEDLAVTGALTTLDDGTRTLSLDFSERIDSGSDEVILSYASIIYTLTGFIPGVNKVELYVSGNPITSIGTMSNLGDGIQRSDFTGYIGSSALLYFDDSNSDLLLAVSRSMEQGRTWSARARVLELLRGPLKGDGDDVLPIMPKGVTDDDILSVDVYGDTAYVNLSQNFKDACAGMTAKTEMLLVYAIVNTITAMDGISKVQFLIEGQQTRTLAGTLCLSDPFLKNYGIIKDIG